MILLVHDSQICRRPAARHGRRVRIIFLLNMHEVIKYAFPHAVFRLKIVLNPHLLFEDGRATAPIPDETGPPYLWPSNPKKGSSSCRYQPRGPPPRLALPPLSASMEGGCTALSFLMSFSLHPHQPCPR